MSADPLRTRAYAAPRRENDEGGRFTNRPSGDSHRAFHPSGCAAVSCGLAARPPFAGRAAPAVAGATPAPEGLVRHSGECVFTTRRSPSRGRSSANDPCRKAVQRRCEAAEQAFRRPAVRRSGGRPRCHSIRRTGLRGPTRPGGPFVLAYVDANVSVSHPNNRARTNRDEEAVALGAGAGARPGRGAGVGWPDHARSGPRRRQRRRLPGTLRRHQGTDRRAGVPVRHGRDLPLFRFRGLRQPHRSSPCGSGGNAGSFARRYARAASATAATCRRPPGASLTFGRRHSARFILTSTKPPGAPRRSSGWAGTFRSEPSTTGSEAIASAHGRNRAPNAGSMAFPHGIAGPGATPREGRMAVHIPTVAVPYQAPEGWGRSGHRPEGPHGIRAPADSSQPQGHP